MLCDVRRGASAGRGKSLWPPAELGPWEARGCVCLGGVLLFRVRVGAVPLALGGLASGFGMGPGVCLLRCDRRGGGGVVGCVVGCVWWVGWSWAV